MNVLVTGGIGFVGSHFVWAAHEAGRKIVVLDDYSGGHAAPLPAGVDIVRGDVGDRALVDTVLNERRISAIVHFAGKIQVGESVRAPDIYFQNNLVKGISLLDAARKAGVFSIIFSSTAAVYGMPERVPIEENAPKAPLNPYGASKLSFEYVLSAYREAYGLRYAALRYFNAAGAHSSGLLCEAHEPETHLIPLVIDAALKIRPPLSVFGCDYPTPDGTCIRDYIHVQDLAQAHLSALSMLEAGQDVGALNLGTGRGYSVKQVMDAAASLLGREIPHSIAQRRPGDAAVLVADPSKAMSLLNWKCNRSDLNTLLEDTIRSRMPKIL